MVLNFPIILLASLIPLVVGFVWYNNNIFGKAWMEASGMNEDKIKGGNMALIFGLSFVLAFLLAFSLNFAVIHQNHLHSLFMGQEDALKDVLAYLDANHGQWTTNFRGFSHGLNHGFTAGLLMITPALATNALFERKSFKYIAINCGYWLLSTALMGGVICQFS